MATATVLQSQPVGALACQKDSYLRSLETEVVSCVPFVPAVEKKGKKSKAPGGDGQDETGNLWQVEFKDSVLFPEGGGQPSDHGTLELLDSNINDPSNQPLHIKNVQRDGLRSLCHSPTYLEPGLKVRQQVDSERRWDHMQQHTGQHLLSAIMDTYPDLETLGWGMGQTGSSNYVDLPRTPSREEMREIEAKCNEVIRDGVPIEVLYPEGDGVSEGNGEDKHEKGVIRVIKMGGIDSNPCCGTHLRQTSHIQLILLQSTQTVRGKDCRLSFVAGARAVALAASTAEGIRRIAYDLSCGTTADDVVSAVDKIKNDRAELRRKEVKLLKEIAKFEGERLRAELNAGRNVFLHRASEGMEFVNMVLGEIKSALRESEKDVVAVLAVGEEKKAGGQLVVVGSSGAGVEAFTKKLLEAGIEVKGNGKGERWQGKAEWKKGDLGKLEGLVR